MSSYNARLRLPGRSKLPLGVEVDISKERMTLTAGDRKVATWPLESLDVASHSDGFHIKVEGDDFVLNVADSSRFAAELGIVTDPTRAVGVVALRSTPTHLAAHDKQLENIERRISDIARSLISDSVSPAMAFAQWLSILKEINRRHGQGSMPPDLFYRLNTKLLDLIPDPEQMPA